ncbi:MAG: hypothetical protein U5N56_03090 [Candidatus Marinimicrobia bacterium]|nr:hypothetical protein [Candidatus Neomarinimicrobiota bacterium]
MKKIIQYCCCLPVVLLLTIAMAGGQTLVIEGTAERREYAVDALRKLAFTELDTLSNDALSLHTTTGIRHIRLADIDSVFFRDSTQLVIRHGGKRTVTGMRISNTRISVRCACRTVRRMPAADRSSWRTFST